MRPDARSDPDAGVRPPHHERALGRIATLVAEGAAPEPVFAAVAEEVAEALGIPAVTLGRYGPDRTLTELAAPRSPGFRPGSRWRLEHRSIAAGVVDTGRPARINGYSEAPGALAKDARASALGSSVGVPVMFRGAVWGVVSAGAPGEQPLPPDTEERLGEHTALVTLAIAHAESQDRMRWSGDERAGVRRLTALVAEGAPAGALYVAVVREAVEMLDVTGGALLRFEPERSATVLAAVDLPSLVPGASYPLDGPSLAATILETGRPARIDDYSGLEGTIAQKMRNAGIRSAFGVPITVDGALWGVIGLATDRAEPLPAGAELSLRDLTESLAGVIAYAEARGRLRRLADTQAALRRVATLVAEAAPAAELVEAVVQEIERVLDAPSVALLRYEPDRVATILASLNRSATAPSADATEFSVGSRWPLDGPSIAATVLDSGRPARVDEYAGLSSTIAAGARRSGVRSGVGVPIVVDGRVWGVVVVGTPEPEPLPKAVEAPLRDFAELVAIAISNAESRDRRARLTEQQAALRRVATLAAEGAAPGAIFAAVTEEVVRIADVSAAAVSRFEPDAAVVEASFNDPGFPAGSRWPIEPTGLQAAILDSGRAATIDFSVLEGMAGEAARASGIGVGVGAPIFVDGSIWGMLAVGRRRRREALPVFGGSYSGRLVLSTQPAQDIEALLAPFTELVAIAISKAQAHDDLRRLAEEQAALRRVATRVAEGASAGEIFEAVVAEIADILGLQGIELARYEPDGTATVLGASGDHPFPPGSTWALDGPSVLAAVLGTGRPARIDDYSALPGTIAETVQRAGFRSAIGAPIVVDGATWGALVAISTVSEPIPERSEIRLRQFTELIATAVSNATARADLIASRARIVTAGDEARRRLERNLHDGVQQRLIALGLDVQRVRAALGPDHSAARADLENAQRGLESVLEEVREVSRGLHPAQLSRGGLGVALRTVARRSPIPVDVRVDLAERLPPAIETAVYYVVSEALTNAIKHSRASAVSVAVTREGATLRATVADDGVGGAVAGNGSGLIGLHDRMEALGGRVALNSPQGRGTSISIELPIAP
jgi:signal transduction histidine kinase